MHAEVSLAGEHPTVGIGSDRFAKQNARQAQTPESFHVTDERGDSNKAEKNAVEHLRQHGLRAVKRAIQIRANHHVPRFRREFPERAVFACFQPTVRLRTVVPTSDVLDLAAKRWNLL